MGRDRSTSSNNAVIGQALAAWDVLSREGTPALAAHIAPHHPRAVSLLFSDRRVIVVTAAEAAVGDLRDAVETGTVRARGWSRRGVVWKLEYLWSPDAGTVCARVVVLAGAVVSDLRRPDQPT